MFRDSTANCVLTMFNNCLNLIKLHTSIILCQEICNFVTKFITCLWSMHFCREICHPNLSTFSANFSVLKSRSPPICSLFGCMLSHHVFRSQSRETYDWLRGKNLSSLTDLSPSDFYFEDKYIFSENICVALLQIQGVFQLVGMRKFVRAEFNYLPPIL